MTMDRIRSVLIKDTTREERIRIVNRFDIACRFSFPSGRSGGVFPRNPPMLQQIEAMVPHSHEQPRLRPLFFRCPACRQQVQEYLAYGIARLLVVTQQGAGREKHPAVMPSEQPLYDGYFVIHAD